LRKRSEKVAWCCCARIVVGLERRSHGDLGLPVPDVAADEAIHRCVGLHVVLDLVDRTQLIRRLFVREGVFQLALPRGVGTEAEALRVHPCRVQLDELRRDPAGLAAHAGLGLRPLRRTQTAHPRRFPTDVARDEIDLIARHVQAVAFRVIDDQVLAMDPQELAVDHPGVSPDAVDLVHD
jgi:hypothetical protein